ncbi:hypothetical protein ACWGF2_03730 [Streptomyces sp. NPDC054919]
MSHIPDAPARLVSPGNKDEHWTFRVKCPYCPRIHIHGAGPSAADAHTAYGNRVAHCTDVMRNGKLVYDAAANKGRTYNLVPAVQR